MIVYFDNLKYYKKYFDIAEEVRLEFLDEIPRVEIRQWLEQNGSGSVILEETIFRHYWVICSFENKDDATLFKLRWGGV